MAKRNYAAEYARRIARAKEKGYSKAVARGHARRGEFGLKRSRELNVPPGFRYNRKRSQDALAEALNEPRLADLKIDAFEPGAKYLTTNQEEFLAILKEHGFKDREAYTTALYIKA
jgi:hypothetical protein